jgi:hypothetical protein
VVGASNRSDTLNIEREMNAAKSEERTMAAKQWTIRATAGAVLFAAGLGAGTWHERSVEAQNRFGQPKTVIHMVVYKFKPYASEDDKQQALSGIKTLAGQIPGVKNIWLKTGRNQIRDFDGVFAIEFTSAEAAADYAESPKHEAWAKKWEELRENSVSFQATNP